MKNVWWNIQGIVLLDNKQSSLIPITINFVIQNSLRQKKHSFLVNREGVIFHHNDAHSHTVQLTKDLLEELNWEKLLHHSYSPDLVPSDYHLVKGLQNHLDGLRLTSREKVEHKLVSYFASKPKEFYKCDISKLINRLNDVLGSNGGYVNGEIFL